MSRPQVILIGSGSGAVPCLSIVDEIANRLVAQAAVAREVAVSIDVARPSADLRRRTKLEEAIKIQDQPSMMYAGILRALGISMLLLFQFIIGGLEVSWYILGVRQENTYIERDHLFLRPIWRCGLAAQVLFGLVICDDLRRKIFFSQGKKVLFSDLLDLALFVAGAAAEGRWSVWRSNGGRGPWRRQSGDAVGRAVLAGLRFFRLWARNSLVQNAPKKAGHSQSRIPEKYAKSFENLSLVKSLDACIISPDAASAEWLLPTVAAAQQRTVSKLQTARHPTSDDFNVDVYLTRADDVIQASKDCQSALAESSLEDMEFLNAHVFCGFPDLMRLIHDRMVKSAEQPASTTCIFFCGPATLGEQIQEVVYRANLLFGDSNHTVLYYDDIYVADTAKTRRIALAKGTIDERADLGTEQIRLSKAVSRLTTGQGLSIMELDAIDDDNVDEEKKTN